MSTWLVEYGSQPPKRPSTATILDGLNKEVDNWGKSTILPCGVKSTGGVGCRAEDEGGFSSFPTESPAPALTLG